MSKQTITQSVPTAGQQHLYLLPTHDNSCVKIGRSINPLSRIAGLMYVYPEIDLSRAVLIEVDSHRIESVVHTVFSLRRLTLPGRIDGCTEWFAGDCLDEVFAFIQQIARHRQVVYPVFGQLEQLLLAYRTQNPLAGLSKPRLTGSARLAQAELDQASVREAILDKTQHFIDALSDVAFEQIVHHDGQWFLSRTVRRDQEPAYWQVPFYQGDQVRKLTEQAHIKVGMGKCRCSFSLITPPIFVRANADLGHEYFRICESRPMGDGFSVPLLINDAVAEFWSALSDLPEVESPHDPRTGPAAQSLLVEEAM